MRLGKDDIIRYVKEQNIKSINLSFCDVFGNERNVIIPPEEIHAAFDTGIPLNISGMKNFGEGIYSVTVDTSVYDHVIFNGSGGQTEDVDVAYAESMGGAKVQVIKRPW